MNLLFNLQLNGQELKFLADVANEVPHSKMSGRYRQFVAVARQLDDAGLIEKNPRLEGSGGHLLEQECASILTARGRLVVELLRMESADLGLMFPDPQVKILPLRRAS